MRIGIVSPNPTLNSGGVERFCHTLRASLSGLGASAEVLGAAEAADFAADLVITNGMVGRPMPIARVHVYHGCWVEHVRHSHREASLHWRARFLAKGVAREIRAGRRAYRVAVSDSAAHEVRRWYGYRVHRVVPNGVDTAEFAPGDRARARRELGISPSERVALFIGRPETRKRPDIAVAAAARAGYRLYLAGSGSVPGAVSLGVQSPAALAGWVRAADCVLAPSEYEACSIAILEAFSAGTPVVASRVGWIETLLQHVPGYVGLTSPRGDVEGFTAALDGLATTAHAVPAAVSYVRTHNSLEAFGKQWAAVVEDVLRRRQKTPIIGTP